MKYYLIKAQDYEEVKVNNTELFEECGEEPVKVELKGGEINLIISKLEPQYTGFEGDVEHAVNQNCANLQDKIRKVLE